MFRRKLLAIYLLSKTHFGFCLYQYFDHDYGCGHFSSRIMKTKQFLQIFKTNNDILLKYKSKQRNNKAEQESCTITKMTA